MSKVKSKVLKITLGEGRVIVRSNINPNDTATIKLYLIPVGINVVDYEYNESDVVVDFTVLHGRSRHLPDEINEVMDKLKSIAEVKANLTQLRSS